MTETVPKTGIYESLDALLDRERAALMGGDMKALAQLVSEKEELLKRVALEDGEGRSRIEALQGKAIRNQALLDSALQGIRTVANRFATLRRIRKTLETYDEFGQKSALPAVTDPRVERRA